MGLYKAISRGQGERRAACQPASVAKKICVQLHYLLGPIRKPGDRKCVWGKQAFKAFLLHTSKLLLQIPLQKSLPAPSSSSRRLARAAQGRSLLVWLSSLPGSCFLYLQPPEQKALLSDSPGRAKELELGKMVFNGAAATNQASYEHVKNKKPAGKQVDLSHARGWFGMRRAALSEKSSI